MKRAIVLALTASLFCAGLVFAAPGGEPGKPKKTPTPTATPTPGPTPSASPTPSLRIALVLINFTDDQREPYTPTTAAAELATFADYYSTVSHGQVTWTGDVYGWWTVPYPKSPCSTALWKAAALEHFGLPAEGEPGAYDHYGIAFPLVGCGFGARAGSFYSGSWIEWQDIAHEVGHYFGLQHANSLLCSDGVLTGTCSEVNYGDRFSEMGNVNRHWFNAWERTWLGWLDNGQVVTSGDYALGAAQAATSTDPQMLMVPRGNGTYFVVELRGDYPPYDDFDGPGVLVRIADGLPDPAIDNLNTLLLDAMPGTNAPHDPLVDWALPVGQVLTDPLSGATLEVLALDAARATVRVTVP